MRCSISSWRLPRNGRRAAAASERRNNAGGKTRLGAAELVDAAYARGEAGSVSMSDTPPQSYSAEDALLQKDFATFRDDDLREARRYLRRLAPKLATATTRRRRPARSGREVDLRSSLKLAARHGGEVLRLAHRRRRSAS